MKDFIKIIDELTDRSWLSEHILNLYRFERRQTFPAYQAAANYVYDLLKQEGFEAEYLDFPADGVTTYQDKITPIGWDAENMRLTVLSDVPGLKDPIIADFASNPLSVAKHSVSTPPEGITTRLVTETQMKAGADVTGAFVLLERDTFPGKAPVKMLLDLGAVGWVSDFLEKPLETPQSVTWVNAATENNSWHVQAGDRDFIGFQITPETGLALRSACQKGEVMVHAFSDGRRYESTLPAVTGLLPGEDPREIWMCSHLYEPLIDDNNTGVIGSIAILKALRTLAQEGKIRLKYSVRVVLASEMYGFAAVAEKYGGDLSKVTIGGINTDGMFGSTDKTRTIGFRTREAADHPGFAGNILMHMTNAHMRAKNPAYRFNVTDHNYSDDCFMNDATVGLPTIWLAYWSEEGYHHDSYQDETIFDVESCGMHVGFVGDWVRAMAAMTEEEVDDLLPAALEMARKNMAEAVKQLVRPGTDCKARMEFIYNRERCRIENLGLWGKPESIAAALAELTMPEQVEAPEDEEISAQTWYNYTADFTFGRLTRGFPHDLVKAPHDRRESMPGSIINVRLADLLSRMDGEKSMKTLIDEIDWDRGSIMDEETVESYLHTCIMLAEYGYLSMEHRNALSAADLYEAVRAAGVEEGDTVLVMSDLKNLGYLYAGSETIIAAMLGAVGDDGTFLAPAFADSCIYSGGQTNRSYAFRPYDTRPDGALRDKTLCWRSLAATMSDKEDVFRSGHPTHEWFAMGADAEALVSGHGFTDAPAGETSPMAKALEKGGKILFIGCGTQYNPAVYLAGGQTDDAVIRYVDANGSIKTALIPQYFCGELSREFCWKAALSGLTIREQPFGISNIYCMDLAEVKQVAEKLL